MAGSCDETREPLVFSTLPCSGPHPAMEDPLAAADRLSFGMAFLIFVSVAGIVLLMFLTTASETPSTSARAGSGKVRRVAPGSLGVLLPDVR